VSQKGGRPDLYAEAGVDVAKGDRLVEWLQQGSEKGGAAKAGKHGSVVSGIGGFAALFRPDFRGLADPLLITSTDGVGTKVLLGIESGQLTGLGIDLVAMCVNDLYTIGGRPLLFLDYYATGILEEQQFKDVLSGIKAGCAQSGAALLGGETAALRGLYAMGHFDLAGFVVGVVDGERRLGAHRVQQDDVLYALTSSGFHSNGYSLLRKWVASMGAKADAALIKNLMTPTRIYHEIPQLVDDVGTDVLHALANITGGGISGNLPRVLPKDVECHIDWKALPLQPWVKTFIAANGATLQDLEAVFNLGCGMIASVSKGAVSRFEKACVAASLPVVPIGNVRAGGKAQDEATVVFH
jgi:phosphoribosylformylglycinamidine cyclo-ligase